MASLIFNSALPEHFGYYRNEYTPEGIHISNKLKLFKNNEDSNSFCYKISSHEGRNKIETSFYIGVDWIESGKLFLQVEPKLNSNSVQTDYLRMLSDAMTASETSEHVKRIYEIRFDEEPILIDQKCDFITPLLLIQYINVLKGIVKKGLIKSYRQTEQNLKSRVKGKILVGATVKENLTQNKPLYTKCRFQVFDEDIPQNRVLKKALDFAKRYLNTFGIKADQDKLNYISPAFENVSSDIDVQSIKNIKINSFFKEYKSGLELAQLIIKRFGYNITSIEKTQKVRTPPFWIDMSLLFELYVLGMLERKFKNGVAFQFEGYGVYPDYLLQSVPAVADAKYKPLYKENKYDIDNIRQIAGYSRDNKIRNFLQVEQGDQVACWIIYPDQENGIENWKEIDEKLNKIQQFDGFYKIGVKLPEINSNGR